MKKSILMEAGLEENWQAFLQYKLDKQHLEPQEEAEIRDFISRKAYLPICALWEQQQYPSTLPLKKVINKQGTQKKRIVYSFPGDEGIFLKFIAFYLFQYDACFCDNCYAFRRNVGVMQAMRRIQSIPSLAEKYCLKVDISNYFNSIDVNILLDKLSFIQDSDLPLYQLFQRILKEERVQEHSQILTEQHGAMAGTPISPFFANVYLREVDQYFKQRNVIYFRYSDDILLFADTMEELMSYQADLYEKIGERKLTINPNKVHISAPGETWEFLGFCYREGEIDLSDTTIRKIKAKIKRKADALRRWQRKKGLPAEKAAIGLIHTMNRKFFGCATLPESSKDKSPKDKSSMDKSSMEASSMKPSSKEKSFLEKCSDKKYSHEDEELSDRNDFTWSRWFFPNLTVDTGLKLIDAYLQEYIRYTVTGRHYKGNYRISYNTLKKWGYRSLVHEYYDYRHNG